MDEREALILGALLHDIGKFVQRAEVPLSQQSKNMESSICPVYKGVYTRKHLLWTNEFFEAYKSYFPSNVFQKVTKNPLDNCANIASYHHRADTPLQMIVQEADRLSSGMDRLERDIEDEISGRDSYKKIRLHSIFEKIDLGNNPGEPDKYRYELNPLVPDKETFFPKRKENLKPSERESLVGSYLKLWEKFIEEFKNLPQDDFNTFINALLSLMEKHTWCIPSSTIDLPDISLYDHSKTTAAIAACLYEFHKQTNSLYESDIKNRDTKKFLLVGGDLSGIQKYLFNLSHSNIKGVSKMLRARSFYLGALCDVSAHYLLHRLNLPLLCNVMAAGGRFILLAPNTEEIKHNLSQAYREISGWYKKSFAGELVLNLDWNSELSGTDFQVKNFSNILSSLNEYIEAKKYHRLFELIAENDQWIEEKFLVEELYRYENGTCQSCNKQPAVHIFAEEGRERRLCRQCHEQEKVGRYLTRTKIVAYSSKKPLTDKYISFFNDKYFLSFWYEREGPRPKTHYLLEELYELESRKSNYGVKFLANHIPIFQSGKDYNELCPQCDDYKTCETKEKKRIGIPQTFQCIATKGLELENETKIGSLMLGVLKADVDGLGFIFGIGLGERMSISRYSTLSRMMHTFFSGYLETMMHRHEYQNIYTVFAGGDDLFLISDWETMIKFSKEMYEDFRDFTCQNEDITLSAGVAAVKPHFPISRAADIAEELLESSKNSGRNRISVFGTTVEWKNLPKLFDFAEFLDNEFKREESKIRSSFLYRLLKYHNMYHEALEGKIEHYKFHSLMAYDVRRNIEDRKKINEEEVVLNQELLEELQKLYKVPPDSILMKNLKIPLFWVLYKNRGQR